MGGDQKDFHQEQRKWTAWFFEKEQGTDFFPQKQEWCALHFFLVSLQVQGNRGRKGAEAKSSFNRAGKNPQVENTPIFKESRAVNSLDSKLGNRWRHPGEGR
jgi:hypothetical protein